MQVKAFYVSQGLNFLPERKRGGMDLLHYIIHFDKGFIVIFFEALNLSLQVRDRLPCFSLF